jgi:dipeptidyl-peptidase 4
MNSTFSGRKWSTCALVAVLPLLANAANDQSADARIAQRYQHASEVQRSKTDHWMLNSSVVPHWLRGRDQFWYERETPEGHRFTTFDAVTHTKSDTFDHARLAQELAKAYDKPVDPNDLPIAGLRINPNDGSLLFSVGPRNWRFDTKGLTEDTDPASKYSISPDGKLGVFFKNQELWVKDLKSGAETQLTTDGERFYTYGAGVAASAAPVSSPKVVWSPDSSRIFTAQIDDRQVLDAPLVDFVPNGSVPGDKPAKAGQTENPFRPKIVPYRVALPGDVNVSTFRLTIIDAKNAHQIPVRYQPIPATRMNDTPMDGNRMWWSSDAKTAYFVDIERGEKTVHVVSVNAESGAARELFSETSESYVELASNVYTPAIIRPLYKSNQLVWYSERSGWAHLYLYDLTTGKLVRALTSGDWLVNDILSVDEARHQMLISLQGRSKDKSPYYREVARVDLRTGALKVLSTSNDDHQVVSAGSLERLVVVLTGGDPEGLQGAAPSAHYFVETLASADKPSHTVLRNDEGLMLATVENADVTRLPSYWRWPEPLRLLAADGRTEIDGLIFRPADYDPKKKYPIIDYIYGGPQVAHVPKGPGLNDYMSAATYGALGFFAVIIDGRGTTERSRDFHTQSYRKAETASNLEDHIAVIRQLAAKDPAIDLERVGITGFSGGGYMTASALLRYPDFFKVGVAGSGNHDQRIFWNTWGERYEGYPVGDYYKDQANSTYAKNLKGKLLLVHGLLDTGVHPSNVLQLEQALIDANRDYDTLLWPRARHEMPSYGLRRCWDYFIEKLAGEIPPHEFELKTDTDILREKAEAFFSDNKASKEGSVGEGAKKN